MANLIGQHLDRYEILSLLGKGGMATVYRARQTSMERDVAIKVIKPDLAETGDFVTRFQREARTVASLSHPFILKVFDYGQQGDLVYLVMELLTGGSLADLIRRGPLSLETTSWMLDQVASALDYAHGLGIIHRDLKPQNVLLDAQGNAHLTDFGIVKLLAETAALTQSGTAMGTPTYMSPEQWQGRPADARTDVYALGVMLFEMLTGQLPFVADTPFGLMHQHVYDPPPSMFGLRADVPPGLDALIGQALAKDPDERISSAGELAAVFRAALAGQAPAITPPRPKRFDMTQIETPVSKPARRRTLLLVGGGLIIALLLIGGFAILSGRSGQVSSTPTAPGVVIQATTPATPTNAATATKVVPPSTPVPPTAPPGNAPNAVTRAAETLAARAILTANAASTVRDEATTRAIVAGTETALAVTAFTPTLTATATPTRTPVPPTVIAAVSTPAGLLAKLVELTAGNADQVRLLTRLAPGTVTGLAWSPDGKTIAVARPVGVWLYAADNLEEDPTLLAGYTVAVTSLVFSPDGTLLTYGSTDSTVQLLDAKTGQTSVTLQGHTGPVTSVAFSPGGKLLASGSADKTVWLWDLQTSQARATLQGHTGEVTSVAFSPDGKLLASGSDDKTVRLWDVQTGQARATLQGHTSWVRSVAFSPDGTLLASGSVDGTVRLWDVQTGQARVTLQGHTGPVTSVAFSPNGMLLASGSLDNTVRLWDVQTGQARVTLQGHTSQARCVAFSPNGTLLASGSYDGTLRLWGVPTR